MGQNSKDMEAILAVLNKFDPEKLVAEVTALGETWADENAAASALEETRKTVLARFTREYMNTSLKGGALGERPKVVSVASAEMAALADDRYEQHLDLMNRSRREADIARVRYDMGKMKLELMRSQMATVRQEMRTSNFGTT
jgi:hypothetical protein